MACADSIVTTAGATNANAYLSVAEADTYFADRRSPDSTWEDFDDDQKCRAIRSATRLADRMFQFVGYAATTAQALAWPRYGVYDVSGATVSSGIVPERLKDAIAEFAYAMLLDDRVSDSEISAQGIRRFKVGPLELEFSGGQIETKVIPEIAKHLLGDWIIGSPQGIAVRLIRT